MVACMPQHLSRRRPRSGMLVERGSCNCHRVLPITDNHCMNRTVRAGRLHRIWLRLGRSGFSDDGDTTCERRLLRGALGVGRVNMPVRARSCRRTEGARGGAILRSPAARCRRHPPLGDIISKV